MKFRGRTIPPPSRLHRFLEWWLDDAAFYEFYKPMHFAFGLILLAAMICAVPRLTWWALSLPLVKR